MMVLLQKLCFSIILLKNKWCISRNIIKPALIEDISDYTVIRFTEIKKIQGKQILPFTENILD